MKKTVIGIIAALFSSIFLIPSEAATPKALVIIDSYFDSKVYNTNVTCATLSNVVCTDVVTKKVRSLSDDVNHGNAMAEVAKKQNPELSIILLRAGNASKNSVSGVNAGDFINALLWVQANRSKVGAVSISRHFTGNQGCSPAATNTAAYGGIIKADNTIRALILSLKQVGIPVFASTGNTLGTKIGYPGCILDTVSVSVGETNSQGVIISNRAFNGDTDYLASSSINSYESSILGLIAQTTSSGTAAVAAQWMTAGNLASKVVMVNP